MSWQHLDVIQNKDVFEAYKAKYGSSSDYQKDKEIFWKHPEVQASFQKALGWLDLKPGDRLLDIGINNGYDIELVGSGCPRDLLDSLQLIGFDLADDALSEAHQTYFSRGSDWKFVRGDIATFCGINICDGRHVEIAERSIDVVIALASLQSSSLANDFDAFITELVGKLSDDAQLFIGLPNFHLDESGDVVLGLFDAKRKRIDHSSCPELSDRLIRLLDTHGYRSQKIGERIIFHHFCLVT
jgi:hypothetical protein